MSTFDEIMAMAAPPVAVVPLIVAGDHLARIRDLEQQAADAPAPESLGDVSPAMAIAEEIARLQGEMAASAVEFHLRAMPGRQWSKFKMLQPTRGKDEAPEEFADRFFTWMCSLVSLTCVEPKMTPEQVGQLADKLPGSSWDRLSDEAWSLNAGVVSVPFSAAAFGLTRSSGPTSKAPSGSAPATAGGAAKSPAKRRRTSTTRPAA